MEFKIDGFNQLQKSLDTLGKIPQKHVNSATKKAITPVLKDAKKNSPVDTGNLKKGIIRVPEQSMPGKKVYRIVFDRAKNSDFQKKNKNGKITGYYPVSQEYGFFAKDGRYIPGYAFVRKAFTKNVPDIEENIVKDLKTKIDAEIVKNGMR